MAKDRKSKEKSKDRRIRYDLQEKPSKGDTALETADLVFTSVATAASMSPIPLVGEAAGIVLEVLTVIQVRLFLCLRLWSLKSCVPGYSR